MFDLNTECETQLVASTGLLVPPSHSEYFLYSSMLDYVTNIPVQQ